MKKTTHNDEKLKVVIYSFDKPQSAHAHVRILQHLRQWPAEIEIIYGVFFEDDEKVIIKDNYIPYGDIFIIQRLFPSPETVSLLSEIWKTGRPVIYDTDELLTEIVSKEMKNKAHAKVIAEVIGKADLVTVSTQTLLEHYKPYTHNIKLVPDLLDEKLWVQSFLNKRDTEKLVIGFNGMPDRETEVGIVEDALIHILNKYADKVVLRANGCITDRLLALKNVEYSAHLNNYFDFVYQSQKTAVDIAIVPLLDTTLDKCRSNIQWIEYSTRGIAGIYSNVGPYKECIKQRKTGLLVENNVGDWILALEDLIESESLRTRIADCAQQEVHLNYSLNRDRLNYLSLLKELQTASCIKKDDSGTGLDINLTNLMTELDLSESNDRYQLWLKQHTMSEIDAQIYAERMINKWTHRPLFHIFCQVTDSHNDCFLNTIKSLQNQLYKDWKLTILLNEADHIPSLSGINNIEYSVCDNHGTHLNDALHKSNADWIMLFNEGTLLESHALIALADYINANQEWECIYTDHDSYEHMDYFKNPFFKPDINKDYLFSMNYIGNALTFKREALIEAGGFVANGCMMNYEAILNLITYSGTNSIGHVHDILFHFKETDVPYNETTHKSLLKSYFTSNHISVSVMQGYLPDTLRVVYNHDVDEMVSIIIPSRNMLEYLQPCVESIIEKTKYLNYEVIVIDNGSDDPDVFEFYSYMQEVLGEQFRVLNYPFEFNYSAMINLGVENSRAEYILQLNNDTLIIQAEWLSRLMNHAQRPEVGVVGAKLLFPENGMVQHAGIILGMHDIAGHPYADRVDIKHPGYMNRAQVDQQLSAVTGACLLTRKKLFNQVEGMDSIDLKVSYNDVDLCLKVKELGYCVVWTPYSVLMHHGSVSQLEKQGTVEKKLQDTIRLRSEHDLMLDRWRDFIKHDPAYNIHLSLNESVPQPDYTCVINWHAASKERPRVLGMPVSGGSGEYRVKAPLRVLARAGIAQIDYSYCPSMKEQRILSLSEVIRAQPDTILVQNFLGDTALDALEKYQKHSSTFITYLLDDLITHLPEGNSYRKNIPVNARTRLRKGLKLCDRLIVSTEPLKDLYSNMIDDIVVIPNYLESSIWTNLQSQRQSGPKPRVGWAGAQQHSDDLAFIEEVVKATANEVDWIFFGMCPNRIRPYVSEIHGYEFDFEKYAEKLASLNLDLAIAPLMLHPFNEGKSNLRILEYGAMGWPVICTDIYPYKNAPVKRVNNDAQSWINAIRERIYDLDTAYKEGDELKTWVLTHHLLEQHVDTWADSLLSTEIKDAYQGCWQENARKYLINS